MLESVANILAILSIPSIIIAVVEYFRNRDFQSMAKVWEKDAQGIANACIVIKDDVEKGKVKSIEEVGGRVKTLTSSAYSLHASIKKELGIKD